MNKKSDHDNINDKNYCTIYIVRHGETEWNVERRYQGQQDSPLTELGKEQATRAAKKFKNIHFDAIFSSDLPRAKQTAEAIALEHKMVVITNKILRERHFGTLEGKTMDEAKQDLKDAFEEFENLIYEKKFRYKFVKGMESDEEISIRMITFLREISIAYAGKTVLMVAHGGIMRAFLIKIGFAPYSALRQTWIENTGHLKLHSDGIDFFVDETVGITISN